MGYNIRFDLKIITIRNEEILIDKVNMIINRLFDLSEDAKDCIDEDGDSLGPSRWLNYEVGLLKLSLKYPDLIFCLYMDGDDDDDFWVFYVNSGLTSTHRGKVSYPKPILSKFI